MPKDSQAQADSNEEPLVDDPLDTSNVPDEGVTELDNYFAEVDGMEMDDEEMQAQAAESESTELPKETFVDEDESSDGEDQESEDESDEEANDADADDEQEEPDDDNEPEATAPSTAERFRLRAKDEVEAEAFAMRKRHPEWSLKECIEKAEQVLGVGKPDTTEQAPEKDDSPTVKSISEQIKELRSKRKEASSSLEFETAEELQNQIDELTDQRDELRFKEKDEKTNLAQRKVQEFEQAFAQSKSKTVKFYPDTKNPDSELVKRMIAMDERLLANDDPIYDSPDKPFILAKTAARELGIIMADPNTAGAKSKAKKSSQGSRPVQPASGSARTTAAAPTRRLDDTLDSMDSLEDYESLVEAI